MSTLPKVVKILAIMATSSSDRSFSKNRESVEGENTHSPSSFSDQEIDGQICQKVETDSVKNTLSSIQSNDLGVRRESNDLKTTHSTSSNSFVFSVQTAEEILSKTSDELNVSLSETKLHSEAVKFFEYYSDKNLTVGQLKVKARTWIDNCKKYPDFKNKKYDTVAKEGLIGVLREECEKEMIEQEKGFKPKEQNSNPLLVTDFYDAMKKEGYSNSIFEYPIK